MRAARAQGYGLAREVDIPLPLKGMFSEANNAEVSGLYAGELLNWRSTGASLKLRPQHSLEVGGRKSLQRIAFEFGDAQSFIEIGQFRIQLGTNFILRDYTSPYTAGFISGYGLLADGGGAPVLVNNDGISLATFTTDTGYDPALFDGVIAHQDRAFFWRTGNELDFYYGDVGAITGTLTRFPLGRLGNITGKIVAMKSLTIDAGQGMNDVLAVFTSTGQIVCYEGLDPGDADQWRQINRIRVAPPISKNAFVEVGADLWMLTASGVVSVLDSLRRSSQALINTISRPVQDDLIEMIEEGGDWSMHMSADARRVIINRVLDGASTQLTYWTDNPSWTRTDYPAISWHNLGIKTYFTATDGEKATLGAGDQQITATWVSSWFRLPRSTGITYLRPTIIANGALEVSVTLLSNHDETQTDVTEATQTVTLQPDNPADSGGRVSLDEPIAVDATGDVFQIRMEVTATWAELVSVKAGVL